MYFYCVFQHNRKSTCYNCVLYIRFIFDSFISQISCKVCYHNRPKKLVQNHQYENDPILAFNNFFVNFLLIFTGFQVRDQNEDPTLDYQLINLFMLSFAYAVPINLFKRGKKDMSCQTSDGWLKRQ